MNSPPNAPTAPLPSPKRAHGRSLADFEPLRPAEQTLLDKCAKGEEAKMGDAVPADDSDPNKIVRAGFLRFLLLGGDDNNPVHEQGVRLHGAWIEGELDLQSCRVPHGMELGKCKFDQQIVARDAHIAGAFVLSGSHLQQGLRADRLQCDASVFLRNNFQSFAAVRLLGAQIGGQLNCSGGQFEPKEGDALSADEGAAIFADGVVVKGNVVLSNQFKAKGTVRLLGAQIDGQLNCSGGQFEPKEGYALVANQAIVKGDVALNKSFKATNTVLFLGIQIGSSLDCSGGQFSAEINLQTAVITSRLILRDMATPVCIDATFAQIGELVDDPKMWAKGSILDGLVYRSISGTVPIDAAQRIDWLKQQSDKHLGEGDLKQRFRPQPWKQLQKVLREMGHDADARRVGVAFEDQLRKADRIGQITDTSKAQKIIPVVSRQCLRGLHWLFGKLAGYGYHPTRLFMSMVAVWLFCAVAYWWLALPPHNALGPTDPLVFQNPAYAACTSACMGNWFLCPPLPAEYTTFSPLAYSLDLLLPLVDLGQEKNWGPLVPTPERHFCVELFSFSPAHWVRLLNWFEVLYGWVASLLFVAIVSGMSRRSETEK